MNKLRVLDLFSGIGGFSLGLERTGGFETAAFCEIEDFPCKVLAKHWPDVPIIPDVRNLERQDIDGPIDVICGGYPCQPFSTAGKRAGEEDDRHLWPEVDRLLDVFRPTWFIGENVAGHISMGLDSVLSDLEDKGYTARTFLIPACAVDAKHDRLSVGWGIETVVTNGREPPRVQGNVRPRSEQQTREVLAHSASQRQSGPREPFQQLCSVKDKEGQAGDALAVGEPRIGPTQSGMGGMVDGFSRWLDEPDIGRVATGVKNRANRLKGLGNAVVPQIPEMIGYAILEAEGRL